MRDIRENFKPRKIFSFGIVKGEHYLNNGTSVFFIGVFNNHIFEGTDRLSMAVLPKFLTFIKKIPNDAVIVFEGDRLFTAKLFKEVFVDIYIIECSKKTLKERREKRGTNQNPSFLKSKETKIENIKREFDYKILINNTEEDYINNKSILYNNIIGYNSC